MFSFSKQITDDFQTAGEDRLDQIITHYNWSCGVFEGGYRNKQNFRSAEVIALDFDNMPGEPQMTLKEAKEKAVALNLEHVISTTRSHRKPKKDAPPADRFRIVFRLAETITNPDDFETTWRELHSEFPAADPACKDASRFFYPSQKVVQKQWGKGKKWPVKKYQPKEGSYDPNLDSSNYGQLSKKTKDFLLFGAPEGQWNATLTKAAIDFHEQGYPKEEAMKLLQLPCRYGEGDFSAGDLRCIDSVYNKDPRYSKRSRSGLNFMTLEDLSKQARTLKWTVEGMLLQGGLSILSAPPKCGKSVLARNAMASVMYGEPFLDREIKEPGPCMYLALEDHPVMVETDMKRMGIKADSNFYVHCGPVSGEHRFDDLAETIQQIGAKLVVIDTLALFCSFTDINDYGKVNAKMEQLRAVARDTGVHIMTVHHANKGMSSDSSSILGSNAIFGAVDASFVMRAAGSDRILSSWQRGGTPFNGVSLVFDEKTLTYRLGSLADGF